MTFLWIFIVLLYFCYSSYKTKLEKLKKEIKLLKRSMKGESAMSKLIGELKGKKCLISCDDALLIVGDMNLECEVIDVDDEWIKIRFKDKKGVEKVKIIRIDTIKDIELID
ncbi:hypothetical protein Curi_c26160 [Gottschalkia acidurici 9a]|uniref:Uncharacterized protein n=1 Tax=Gottschalkia acidurici (strain ATCC 7906 / DSM 604 / BCRC 14475 / CIP 104303 / KCTC 5404 / NCIMB 10678 / 9a) TaxID=1128398 RepID=K0B4W5_GOTA9|nr:hypothetical protein [Gottschalkia acidurici]AFS79611.1 hypothetical protein Curi_c26160 [Gottschalkia acidurici 9a]